MLSIFSVLPGFVWAALLAAALLANGVQAYRLMGEQTAHAKTGEDFAIYRDKVQSRENTRAQEALAQVEANNELERMRSKSAMRTQDDLLAENSRTAAARAVADERRRVSDNAIDTFAAPNPAGGQASGDPAALRRAEEATATLGRLLKTCRAEGGEDAGELEALASQVRGLISRYEALLLRPAPPPPTAAQPVG